MESNQGLDLRVAIVGQQKFGRAVLEALLARGDRVAGVFCAPEKSGAPADPLRLAAQELGVQVYQFPSLRTEEAQAALRALDVDLGLMAYVLQFAPREFIAIPRHGMIQYHPSLLPRYRGPSAINWPIIHGDAVTGLTIFRPTDGLDEGPVILQRSTPIGPDDTLGSVYFDRLFPEGVAALLEAAERVVGGGAIETLQDESQATYEGWCRAAEARINWHSHVDLLYNLIRGCNPVPGAWTLLDGRKVQVFDARKHVVRAFSQIKGPIGTVTDIGADSLMVAAQGGQIEIFTLKMEDGKKLGAAQFCAANGLSVGATLGT